MLNESTGRSGFRRLGVGIAAAAVGALLLTGCAAGQVAQTANQTPAIDGVSAAAANIDIRNAAVITPDGNSYAKGASASLIFVAINNSGTDDTLTSVSSPVASGSYVSNAGTMDSTTASASADASDSTSAAPSASTSADTSSNPIKIPAGQSVQVGYSVVGPNAQLTGLTSTLFPAQSIPVTFTFSSGTTVTATISVRLSDNGSADPTISAATNVPD